MDYKALFLIVMIGTAFGNVGSILLLSVLGVILGLEEDDDCE